VSLLATDAYQAYDGSKEYPASLLNTTKSNMSSARFTPTRLKGFWSIFKRGVVGTFHKMSAPASIIEIAV
jgi:hypothetical protein